MATKWKITHTFTAPVDVESSLEGYPNLGVHFIYSENQLVGLDHELELDDGKTASDAELVSSTSMAPLIDLLAYVRQGPLAVDTCYAAQLRLDGSLSGTAHGRSSATGNLVSLIRFPAPATVATLSAELIFHIHMANIARDTRDPAQRIRTYYVILEDLGVPLNGSEQEKVKWVRDFVSHPKIKYLKILAFLRSELGRSINRYDPRDARSVTLIEQWAENARRLVSEYIARRLR
jgi:hypothetical protein